MDIISYAASKKIAEGAVSGVASMSVSGQTLTINCTDGTVLTMTFPTPADGVSITDVDVRADKHLIVTLSDGNTVDAGEVPTVKGDTGDKGDDGADGKSAYEIAVEQGYSGTEAEWIASLHGADGEDGFSPEITVKESTSERYVLTITTKDGSFDTVNLKGGGSGSASAMSDLEDVQLTSLTTGQILKWNGTKWVNEDGVEIDSLGDINDVNLGTLADGQVLSWDAANQKWVNKDAVNPTQFATMPTPASTLSGIVYQYVGSSSQAFVKGHFYTCLYDNVNDTWYWDEIKYAADTDSALAPTSKNPVANDALYEEFDKKQDKDLETPIEVDGTEQTTVEDTLSALNTYAAKKVDQLNSLPVASADTLGMLVQYKGATTSTLKHAFFYECKVVEGSDPTEYEWVDAGIGGEDLSQYKKIFSGTSAEWDALPLEDKITYDYTMPDDDGETGDIADVVESGNHNPVESDAVFDSEQKLYKIDAAYGVKNLAPRLNSQTINNVTFDVNDDGSVTVNGTATSDCWYNICDQDINNFLQAGENYIASGCPEGGSDTTFFMYIGGSYLKYVLDDTSFTCDAAKSGNFYICVRTNTVMDNVVFYPMIRLASYVDDTYEPYAKTNQQLTRDKADKVSSATAGNFAGLDANGNLTDSGKEASDFATATNLANYINENGAINQFDITLSNTKSVNTGGTWDGNAFTYRGLTYTVNDDNIVITGTPTDNSFFYLLAKNIPADKYTFGGLKDAANIVWDGGFWIYNGNVETAISTGAAGNKNDFTVDLSSYTFDRIKFGIKRKSNTLTNDTIKLFIRKADIDIDVNAPYAKTNRELTKDVANIMHVVQVSGVSIFDIMSDLNSYPTKTEYIGYSGSITNGSSTLGNLLNTGDYGVVSIKKYDEWLITISIISANSNGKTHMACTNKNNTSVKFVNNDPNASTDKVTSTTISKAT